MSMRSIRSELKGSLFPLKVGVSSAPVWARRAQASVPAPGPGERTRRSELIDLETAKREERARGNSEPGET